MADVIDLTEYQEQREQVKEYYANLLILQYRNKQKARETIKTCADLFLCDGLVFQLQDLLDIDKAQGAQLDIIGKILDCPRTVQGIVVDRKFFQFHVNANSLGFSTVDNPQEGVTMRSIKNSNLNEYSLPDYDYRYLLKYKAVVNVMRGSQKDMDELLYSVFGTDAIIRNNKNLSITYILASNSMLAIKAALKLGYFRAPLGVGVEFIVAVDNTTSIFGFDTKNYISDFVSGFATKNNYKKASFMTKNNILF